MGLHLHVDTGLEALADRLAARLADVPIDAFAPELVVVPGDGVRMWLTHALARRLGICANVRFVYPATLVREILGPDAGLGRWTTGPLTWAVHSVLAADGSADAVRARSIADLFDRYTVARPHMARRWSGGESVSGTLADLPDHQRWQPELWRRVQQAMGGASDAEAMRRLADELAAGGLPDGVDLPPRVSLFSITSVPIPHLEVLTAVARHLDVAVFAQVVSPARWQRIHAAAPERLLHPVARESSPIPVAAHRLNRSWGRSGEEGVLLLLDAARQSGVDSTVTPPAADRGVPTTVLGHLQHAIGHDAPGTGGVALDPSIVWHRTFGSARQVEVLRDHLLHLLDERDVDGSPTFQPRDIVVLTPDVERFAPLVESVFAGDPDSGVPAIPVQVADRTMGAENPAAAVGLALLGLLDGRFRASDVVTLAAMPPVARRFGLAAADAERLTELIVGANGRWGLDAADQESAGLPALGTHTLGDALDRVVVGALGGSSGLGVGGVAPIADAGFADLPVAGGGIELLDALRTAHTRLSAPCPPAEWMSTFASVLADLIELDDDRGLQWRAVERTVDGVLDAIELAAVAPVAVDPSEMVALVSSVLGSSSGRPRFATGRVTLSSLTAQRGLPHRVVCLLGMDLTSEPSGFGNPDDLTGAAPCLGDRDRRGEYRAQVLDAVMAAQDRLVVCSTGFDVRTRAEVAPAVAVSELVDAVGELLGRPFEPIDHPRQAWSESSFAPAAVVGGRPWSHDIGAARAAAARRHQTVGLAPLPVLPAAGAETSLDLFDLRRSVSAPVRVFCEDRLGLNLRTSERDEIDVQIPLGLDSLQKYEVRRAVLDGALAGADRDALVAHLDASGDVPPLTYGRHDVDEAVEVVERMLARLRAEGFDPLDLGTTTAVSIPGDDRRPRIDGEIAGVVLVGSSATIVDVRASSLKAAHVIDTMTDLVVATVAHPDRTWSAVLERCERKNSALDLRRVGLAWRDPAAAVALLELLVEQRAASLTTPIPFFTEVTHALVEKGTAKAAQVWEGSGDVPGARADAWNRLFFDHRFDEFVSADLERQIDRLWRPMIDAFEISDEGGATW
jgi:exodeoxyribonuclease V gamma subunit